MRQEKFEIVVSGAAHVSHCCDNIEEITKEVGREIARQNCNLVTGATTGVPYFAALGCKEAGGFNIGFSPAASEKAHLKTYRLPLTPFDIMIYTGADYTGRNIIMTKSADGVIIICGRMGTLHEFVTAFELQKPIGVLEGSGGTADKIRQIATGPYRGVKKIIYEKDPKTLVKNLIELIKKEKKQTKGRLGNNNF
ncbi:MAG: hypothetical protein QME57_00485 [Patescibacteria group bacterium]|nr:hypothetical protein [Patescibacteria group bacterium]